ncbi:MAG: hypothetical protein GC136_06350 [Alphaproteobacteria bacterium]|nr:hypothetical protein [Alphaproteobacteria bacterium]
MGNVVKISDFTQAAQTLHILSPEMQEAKKIYEDIRGLIKTAIPDDKSRYMEYLVFLHRQALWHDAVVTLAYKFPYYTNNVYGVQDGLKIALALIGATPDEYSEAIRVASLQAARYERERYKLIAGPFSIEGILGDQSENQYYIDAFVNRGFANFAFATHHAGLNTPQDICKALKISAADLRQMGRLYCKQVKGEHRPHHLPEVAAQQRMILDFSNVVVNEQKPYSFGDRVAAINALSLK